MRAFSTFARSRLGRATALRSGARNTRRRQASILINVRLWQDASGKSHLRRFANSKRRLRDSAHLAGQSDFAEHRRGRRNDPVPHARRDRREDAQVRCRFVDRHSSRDVDEHVVSDQVQPGPFLEHREQQRQSLLIYAVRRPACRPVRAGADERLHFDEDRTRTFDRAQDSRSRRIGRALGEKHLRRVRNRPQPGGGHLEHAELADRAKPVLHGPHHAVGVVPLPFEIQHRVDDVLERFRSGQAAFLGYVSDEEGRDVVPLRREQQLRRGFAHLADAARRRLKFHREDRLHRIHDHQRRFDTRNLFENPLQTRLGEQVQRRPADAEPFAARFDLMLRLLAGAVEDRPDRSRDARRRLQQQGRLANPRLAAEQHERSGDDAAAEDAIELVDARRQPRVLLDPDVRIERRRSARAGERVAMTRRRRAAVFLRALFSERIPFAAVRTSAQPLRRLRSALFANEDGFRRLAHSYSLSILLPIRDRIS